MSTIEALRDFIVSELRWGGEVGDLTPEFALIENHVIDSLGLFMLVSFVETRFGVQVGDEELVPENFGTLDAIADLVERKRS